MQNDGSLKESFVEELEDEFASKAKKRKNSKGNQTQLCSFFRHVLFNERFQLTCVHVFDCANPKYSPG